MAGQETRTAQEITDNILDVTGRALLSGEFAAFEPFFALPYRCSTLGSQIIFETSADLKRAFGNMHDKFKLMRVTDLVRVTVAAEFTGRDRIQATHVSHPMAGDVRAAAPYPVYAIMQRVGGDWKVAYNDYALDCGQIQGVALRQDQKIEQREASHAED